MVGTALTDVLVIGGGPSGSTVSTLLAQRGRSVTVFEKAKFPREHVGESLLPYCYPILDELGVLAELKRTAVRKPGVRFIDVDGRHRTTWCFGHVIKDESSLSFHVRRDRFDDMLLRNAQQQGVSVHEETRVRKVDLNDGDVPVTVTTEGPDGEKVWHGRFIIDCSGRDTFIANRHGWKKAHDELDRVAMSTHWSNVDFTGGLEEGLLQIVYLGGEKKGWIWVIPVGADRVSIGVVAGNAYFKQRRTELRTLGAADWKLDYYVAELNSSPYVAGLIESGSMAQQPVVNGDYSYSSATKFGANFALVGDAHTFIDPIFASGIYLSMNSAKLVAEAVDQSLDGARKNGATPLDGAYEQIAGAYRLVEKAIRFFYDPTTINLAQAASAEDLIHGHHETALASMHYLLAGDFFRRHDTYAKVLDMLAEPALFERYKSLVVDTRSSNASTCGMAHSQVFSEFLLKEASAT